MLLLVNFFFLLFLNLFPCVDLGAASALYGILDDHQPVSNGVCIACVCHSINMYVDQHEDVNEDDIMRLKQELVVVLINTLQQDR